ncbi:hypothetical protein [Candidatus Tisiphia endosymbiont of Hybos culiciformis]|uniref:hypothetical protein n=1 Tax=Candidatus Tisiphia endosymbiont of Hybos culiciformis TaxID=3139331 RepID=UPI003CCAC047
MSFPRRRESIIAKGFLSIILDPCLRRDDNITMKRMSFPRRRESRALPSQV